MEYFTSEWANQTTLHPVGTTVLALLCLTTWLVPRRMLLVPLLVMACAVPQAQRIIIFSLDFDYLRVLGAVAVLRILARGEWRLIRWNTLDWLVAVFVGWNVVAQGINTGGEVSVLINMCGLMFDLVVTYFVVRAAVRDWDDIKAIAATLLILSIPMMALLVVENSTGHNLFSVMGGVPELTPVRDGRMRCQGPFSHPILAGCFWAAAVPLIAMLWTRRSWRWLVVAGLAACVAIVGLCASSTPVFGLAAAVFALGLYPWRWITSWIRWGVVIGAVALHIVMDKPVWHLFARLSAVGGSTGWHRYHLIDEWIKHASEWFVIGSSRGTAHWGWGLFDVTNHYIVFALRGGIGLLVLFITILWIGFRYVGAQQHNGVSFASERAIAWCVGVSLFVHALCLTAVSYFGQIRMEFFLVLATTASVGELAKLRVGLLATRQIHVHLPRIAVRLS